mgnify:CR=1 FL=1
MENLTTFVSRSWDSSKRRFGLQRPAGVAVREAQQHLRVAEVDPESMYAWVNVILAGIEGGLRAGATPFALAQALVNAQNYEGASRVPPPLPHMPESAK